MLHYSGLRLTMATLGAVGQQKLEVVLIEVMLNVANAPQLRHQLEEKGSDVCDVVESVPSGEIVIESDFTGRVEMMMMMMMIMCQAGIMH